MPLIKETKETKSIMTVYLLTLYGIFDKMIFYKYVFQGDF